MAETQSDQISQKGQQAPTAAVIGAGAWGTTLARHLAGKGVSVRLWAYEPEVVKAIRDKQENTGDDQSHAFEVADFVRDKLV